MTVYLIFLCLNAEYVCCTNKEIYRERLVNVCLLKNSLVNVCLLKKFFGFVWNNKPIAITDSTLKIVFFFVPAMEFCFLNKVQVCSEAQYVFFFLS